MQPPKPSKPAGRVISLKSRLPLGSKVKGSADVQQPAFASLSLDEKLSKLRYTDETIVIYVEELEERVSSLEKHLIQLLRVLRASGVTDSVAL